MENKEYYTPTIEELFIGYELEFRIKPDPIKGVTWTKYTIHKGDNIWDYELRTPYLCKQGIIDLGWNYGNGVNKTLFPMIKIDDKTTLFIHLFEGNVKITKSCSYDDSFTQEISFETLFDGTCKSKNELKKLMKDYLNIPI